ncbi:MAG: abortive infection family protein [Alphaproteobacteria bacterium]|nr:abortive infection family protein [Alphaproteobacteria bacterium]
MTGVVFHYPPELMSLLKDGIPKLCRSKRDLLTFFKGAGVEHEILAPYAITLKNSKDSFNKYVVTAEILEKLNESDDKAIRERREIIKRITEFQDFSVCWDNDRAAAIGIVSQIRDVVNVKPIAGTPDIPTLTKATLKELKLVPEGIPDSARGGDVIKRLLQNLGTIGNGLAELRGLYGTGHGKHGKTEGLSPRHAKLAVGAASTLVTFLFDTHKETAS